MDTGERIKQVRKRLGLTGAEFGKLAGVSKAAVSYWESGQTKPERDALLNLKRKRGISPEWITSGKGEMFDTLAGAESLEVIPAWELLSPKQRQEFIVKIKAMAADNEEIRADASAKPVTEAKTTETKPPPKMSATAVVAGPPSANSRNPSVKRRKTS